MAVITISRQFGAGGWTLGQRLARSLGYRYVDEGMINEIAEKVGATPEGIRSFEQEGATFLCRVLNMVVSRKFIDRHAADKAKCVDEEGYVEAIKAVVLEIYKEGNAVIVGRAGQYILKDMEDVWRFLLVDKMEDRIRQVEETHKVSKPEAERLIKAKDRTRSNFLSFFAERCAHDDPLFYDLTLNMENFSIEKADKIIHLALEP